MIPNKITLQNFIESNIENSGKISPTISHNTDTEPEVDPDTDHHIGSTFSLSSNGQTGQKIDKSIRIRRKKNIKNTFEEFINIIPDYQYDQKLIRKNQQRLKSKDEKTEKIAFDIRETNCNRFFNYYEAFYYVAKICKMNNQRFTKEICKRYLKECYIMDFENDGYAPITSRLTPKNLNKYFLYTQRELKFI